MKKKTKKDFFQQGTENIYTTKNFVVIKKFQLY